MGKKVTKEIDGLIFDQEIFNNGRYVEMNCKHNDTHGEVLYQVRHTTGKNYQLYFFSEGNGGYESGKWHFMCFSKEWQKIVKIIKECASKAMYLVLRENCHDERGW